MDNEKAALVFFTNSDNITSEISYMNKLIKEVGGPLNIAVFRVSDDETEF